MTNLGSYLVVMSLATATGAVACGSSKPGPWDGRSYLLAIPGQAWAEPAAMGDEVGAFVPAFLLQVEGSSGDTIDVMIGTADAEGTQEECNPTTAATSEPAKYPEVQIGPIDLPIYLRNEEGGVSASATAYDLTISNVLPEGDSAADEGELSAVMDVRETAGLFTQLLNRSPDGVCGALETFGAACDPCSKDDEPYCVDIKAVGIGATELPDADWKPIEAADVREACLE
jgi:hypothetical protein